MLTGLLLRAAIDDDQIDIKLTPNDVVGLAPKFRHQTDDIFLNDSDRYAFYGLRILSVVFGAANLIILWLISDMIITSSGYRLIAVSIAATLPQYQFLSGSLNNDNLANLLISAVIFFLFRSMRSQQPITFMALGAAFGLALLTKKTSLFIVPAVIVGFGYLLISQPRARVRLLANMGLSLGFAVVLTGPLLARNHRLYGDALGNTMERATMPSLVDPKPLWTSYWFDQFLPGLFESFVARFGWLAVKLPSWVYDFYLAMILMAVIGLVVEASRRRLPASVWFAATIVMLCLGGVGLYNLTYTQYQGRFLFPVLSMICVLIALGLRALLMSEKRLSMALRFAAVSLVTVLVAIDLLSVIALHRFYYRVEAYV